MSTITQTFVQQKNQTICVDPTPAPYAPMVDPVLPIGSVVTLVRGFCGIGDASRGCLTPGSVGSIIKLSRRVRLGHEGGRWDGVRGYLVQAQSDPIGAGWWYAREALCLRGSDAAAPPDLEVGTSVVLRGDAWVQAIHGPLLAGETGEIVDYIGVSGKPYCVKAQDGRRAWYSRRVLKLPGATDSPRAVVAPPVEVIRRRKRPSPLCVPSAPQLKGRITLLAAH